MDDNYEPQICMTLLRKRNNIKCRAQFKNLAGHFRMINELGHLDA